MPRWWPDGDIPLLVSQWPMACTWWIGELWHVFMQFIKKKIKKNPYLPTLILKTIQSETHIYIFFASLLLLNSASTPVFLLYSHSTHIYCDMKQFLNIT
jgi:hypothetical protein